MSEAQIHSAKRNAVFLAVMFGLTGLAHLGRDMWMARTFGTGRAIEAFELVFVLPGLLARFFGGGLLSAMIPRATALLDAAGRSTTAFWEFQRQVWRRGVLPLIVLVAAGSVFADHLVGLLGYGSAQPVLTLGGPLLRILLPSLILSATLGISLASCHARQRFVVPSLAGLLGPLIYLGFLVWGSERMGIRAASWGFLLGQAGALLLVTLYLARLATADRAAGPPVGTAEPDEALRAIGLVLAGWLTAIANLQVDVSMASTLETGSLPALRFGFRLVELPTNLYFSTVGVVLLPTLSRAIANDDLELLRRGLRFAARIVVVLLLPAAVLLATLAPQIISLLYERGAFEAADTARTAAVLRAYAPTVIAYGYLNISLGLLHARRRQGTAALIGVGLTLLNAILNAILMRSFGVVGIAVSTSLVAVTQVVVIGLLEPELRGLLGSRPLQANLLRSLLACAVMFGVLRFASGWADGLDGPVLPLAARGICAAASFVLVLFFLRGGELEELRAAMRKQPPSERTREID